MIPVLFAQLCITVFTWVIRIKSEVGTVKHVEALKFFFLLAQISSIVVLNVKNLAFTPYSVCVCVCACVRACVCWWWWGGGRGQDIITIRPPAVLAGGGGGQWLQMHFTHTTRVGICVRYTTMEMSTGVK